VDKSIPIAEVPALVVVSCAGLHLCVRSCQFCSGTHWHHGCLVPVCSRCAKGQRLGFLGVGPHWNCDLRKTVVVKETWGGKKFCGQHEYHLTLANDPPCYAPGHKDNQCARAIANYLETLGMGAAVVCDEIMRLESTVDLYCERCPPCFNRKS
jgi:hypothetical protein